MADPKPRPSNAADYSASQAPETQDSAHNSREHDSRAIPGGDPARARAMYGMESLDRGESDTDSLQTDRELREEHAPPSHRGEQ